MTKLYVNPIDPAAPGSFRDRARLFTVIEKLETAKAAKDPYNIAQTFRAIEQAIMPRLATDDGTPIEEALDSLSANQFDALLAGLMGHAEETVPPASASS